MKLRWTRPALRDIAGVFAYPAQEMIGRNHIFKIALIEKTILTSLPPTHHRSALPRITRRDESRLHH